MVCWRNLGPSFFTTTKEIPFMHVGLPTPDDQYPNQISEQSSQGPDEEKNRKLAPKNTFCPPAAE